MIQRGAHKAVGFLVIALLAGLPASTAAFAKRTKPAVSSHAWYWVEQQSQTVPDPGGGDAANLELENPFCPSVPGDLGNVPNACREGRMPVEVVGGDYKKPDKISAMAWDFSTILPGSTVKKFTVTMQEASDAQSQPVNADGHQIKACILGEFFGDGDAREYKQAPKFKCTSTSPVAKRKQVPPAKTGDSPTFEWTFDLTKFAQVWVKGKSPVDGVMFLPVKPKKPSSTDNSDWRVVFTGPHDKGGITTLLEYSPPKPAVDTPTPTPTDDGNGNGGTSNTGGGGGGGGSGASVPPATGTDGTDYSSGTGAVSTGGGTTTFSPSGDTGTVSTGGTAPTDNTPQAPQAAPDAQAAADTKPVPIESFPAYVWLAILAGLVGFSLVRRTVMETATGSRPDGVLAQIRQMNAARRGTESAAVASSGPSGGIFKSIGNGTRGLVRKLPGLKGKG